ncbi:caspase family protein [Kribbella sp. CA-245084]|uniref:caspase family protein n=1 Tax=Kribbella sp. CA-245084 TaxID=3239940 RepID=UPI003D916BF3
MPTEHALRDHSGSRAVLIGTWDYQHLPPVPAAQNSLTRMTELLTSPVCGWPADRITTVANRTRPGDLFDELVEMYAQTNSDGVALFYFVGHGQPDSDDRLCLGLAGSRTEAARRTSTSLLFDNVRDALRQSNAETKVVILDCCFAGLAAANKLSGEGFLDMVRGTGAYTMAASGAYSPAWFENDETLSRPQTFFTKYFVDVVEAGVPHAQTILPLDLIFATTADQLVRDGKPRPTSSVRHEAGRLAFARNVSPVVRPVDDQAEIVRLTAALEAAQARAEALADRDLESQRQIERLLRIRQDDLTIEAKQDIEDRLDLLAQSLNDTASETARAVDDRERVRHALVEVAPERRTISVGTGREWDDIELAASTLPVAEVLGRITKLAEPQIVKPGDVDMPDTAAEDRAVQRILLSCGLRPVPELAALAIGLKNADRDADARTVLRLAAQRTGAEIADLVRRLRATPIAMRPLRMSRSSATAGEQDPAGPDTSTKHLRRYGDFDRFVTEWEPLSHAVLAPAALRPADEVVELLTALIESRADRDDVHYLLQCAGWQRTPDQIIDLVEALRRVGRGADADVVLERAGGRPVAVLVELIAASDAQNQSSDILTILGGTPPHPRNAEHRRTLTAALRRTSLGADIWRPLLRAQTSRARQTRTGWWPGPTLVRWTVYSVAALLLGLGLSQHPATPTTGLLNSLATLASVGVVLIAAQLIYFGIDLLVWDGIGSFHHGPSTALIALMAVCLLIGSLVLPPLGADRLGLLLSNWMAWKF